MKAIYGHRLFSFSTFEQLSVWFYDVQQIVCTKYSFLQAPLNLLIQTLWTLAIFDIKHTYVYACTSVHLKFWACMRLSTPTSLCLSTYGFLYVPAVTALSKGHKPLPEMGHFLLADKLCTVGLQGACKSRSAVHEAEILIWTISL